MAKFATAATPAQAAAAAAPLRVPLPGPAPAAGGVGRGARGHAAAAVGADGERDGAREAGGSVSVRAPRGPLDRGCDARPRDRTRGLQREHQRARAARRDVEAGAGPGESPTT